MLSDVFSLLEANASWLVPGGATAGAVGFVSSARRCEHRDARELMRLDVIGFAAEAATVVARVADDLPPGWNDVAELQELWSRCQRHGDRAVALLSSATGLHDLSDETLSETWRAIFEEHQELMQLRHEAEWSKVHRRRSAGKP